MTKTVDVKVPDIGDATDVDVIELLVNVGDAISEGDSIITLESDKASMDVPSSHAGTVKSIAVKVGDKVSEGSVVLSLSLASETSDEASSSQKSSSPITEEIQEASSSVETESSETAGEHLSQDKKDITVPDIGDAKDVDVIDVMIKVGDAVEKDTPLITLEGDKATMDIPSPDKGVVENVYIKVGDKVSEGSPILSLTVETMAAPSTQSSNPSALMNSVSKPTSQKEEAPASKTVTTASHSQGKVYASPSIRRFAREYGIDLSLVEGTGRKSRIIQEDVKAFVKKRLSGGPSMGISLPEVKAIDFSKYGEVEHRALNKIKRLTAQNMHASWITVPHVTQFDEADITELETFRQKEKEAAIKAGYKLTPLAFIVKACVSALKAFPQFNASLSPDAQTLILKQYYNIGIAVDTPNGLVVPVIKNVDTKSIGDIAREMGEISEKARNKALKPDEMSGGSFTISSLGGISGTAFTPIVNAPEVAILGVSRTKWQPVLKGNDFIPRLMLPLSLSYDHRVIDGAEAARFTLALTKSLSDIRTLLL